MLSINALMQFVRNRPALLEWLVILNPAIAVIMDDMGFAVEVKRRLPRCNVFHRSYDPNDHQFHRVISAQQFVNAFCQNVPSGIIVQCLNEPEGYGDLTPLSEWLYEVQRLAPAGVRLALPAWGKGNPKEELGQECNKFFRGLVEHPNNVLVVHEYFERDPYAETGYHILRYKHVHRAFRQVYPNAALPLTAVLEAGTDIGGGVNDGYATRFSQEAYAEMLKRQALLYIAEKTVMGMAVFCYGEGAGE